MNQTVETLVRMLDAANTRAQEATERLTYVQADLTYYQNRLISTEADLRAANERASSVDTTLRFARIEAGPSPAVIAAFNGEFGPSKIPAIKVYCEESGVGLKESKAVVDAWVERGVL
jgi:ribosomal protein L7/L12